MKPAKHDPLVAARVRDVKDLWLEWVNGDASVFRAKGKYDVSRTLAAPASVAATASLIEAAPAAAAFALPAPPARPAPLAA